MTHSSKERYVVKYIKASVISQLLLRCFLMTLETEAISKQQYARIRWKALLYGSIHILSVKSKRALSAILPYTVFRHLWNPLIDAYCQQRTPLFRDYELLSGLKSQFWYQNRMNINSVTVRVDMSAQWVAITF